MRRITFTIIFTICASWSFAQMSISFPKSRIVFQRNNANQANVPITGNFNVFAERIEARAVPMANGQGQVTAWQTIHSSPQGGFFSGNIGVTGGWYLIEVRAMVGNNVVDATDVQRVGVGEVFLVGGQSNAQGVLGKGAPNPNDDRVNTVNFLNSSNQTDQLPQPQYEKLNGEGTIGPKGNSAWYWGALGEQLVARLNVPVLFYNAAWEGTSARVWRESINGTAISDFTNSTYPNKQPYGNMRLALHYYAATTGIRAILWHHGETDNQFNTPIDNYVADLKTVINQTRTDLGREIPWVVAKTSYLNSYGSDANILNAQNQVISSTANTFDGPYTDDIQIPRADGAHFDNGGLTTVANRWNSALNSTFFNSTPIQSMYPTLVASCGNGNQLNVNVLGNNTTISQINWNFGTTGINATLNAGQYQGRINDNFGNVFYSPIITVPNDLAVTAPTINVDGRLPLCQGNSVGLIANSNENHIWNNGSTAARLDVTTAGTYTLTNRNKYGCTASSSLVVNTINSPLPAAPVITPSGPTNFCAGNSVTLTATNGSRFVWSNGSTNNSITVTTSGVYEARTIDSQGCASLPTNTTVSVNSLPNPPVITPQSSTSFCVGGQVRLSSSIASGNLWSNGEQSKDITVTASGSYNVRVRNSNGCEAVSIPVVVKVNALPPAPTIANERPTTFCSGDSTILAASTASSYRWSNSEASRRIVIKNAGTYSVSITDANGCTSPNSAPVTIVVNSLPAPPTISANRTTAICENELVTFSSTTATGYLWSNGQQTQNINTNIAGNYFVRGIDSNGCLSVASNRISLSVTPLPAKPIVTASGPTSFCQGGKVTLQSSYPTNNRWNTTEASQQITVSTAGTYRVSYKDAIGCESFSDVVTVVVNAIPPAPVITNEKPTTFCAGDNTILFVPIAGVSYNWNTGQATQRITPSQSGDYSLSVTNLATGCTSPQSAITKVVVNPLPNQPSITANGPTVICGDQSVTLTTADASGYEWSNGITTKNASVNVEGNYTVKIKNQFGCLSPASTPFFVKVNALPPTPTVVAEGSTSFCEGGQVALRVDSQLEVFWNTNEISRRIVAKQTGNYSARVRDANGCYSIYSTIMKVDVKPAPAAPVIEKIGMFTLGVSGNSAGNTYEWKYNGAPLTGEGPIIKASKAGDYQVSSYTKYNSALTCYSKPSSIITYTPDLSGGGIGIYPNPSNGLITIETIENLRNVTIEVYDANGKIYNALFVPVFDERKSFDLTNLASGTYHLKFKAAGFNLTRKIVIMK